MNKATIEYNINQTIEEKEICNLLATEIDKNLPEAENKIWHRQIKSTIDLKRWLLKARDIQWDYKNIVSKKGKLDRIK